MRYLARLFAILAAAMLAAQPVAAQSILRDAETEAFLDEIGVGNLGLYHDATMGVFNTLKKEGLAYGLPATLLVSDEGCLLGVMNGPAEWAGGDASRLIEELIRQSKGA